MGVKVTIRYLFILLFYLYLSKEELNKYSKHLNIQFEEKLDEETTV